MKGTEHTQNCGRGALNSAFVIARLALFWLVLPGWLLPTPAESAPPVSVVKLLVLYTPQAQAGAGGAAAMLTFIDAAVVEANTVFQNSRVNARIQLCQASCINYPESGSVATDLARLRTPGTGVLTQAHALRDYCGADLVCLVTETGSDWWFYGLQGPSADNAFSILRRPCLTGGYYLPVVLSFNFGCQLETPYADSAAAFPYAYGYSFAVGNTLYSTAEAFTYPRIPYLSNPDVLLQGVPLGIAPGQVGAADNARVMNQTAPLVAAFRGAATTTLPPRVSLTAPAADLRFPAGTDLLLTVTANDPDGRVVRVDYYEGTNRLAAVKSPPFRGVWPRVPAGQHSLFAVATDDAGASTISDPVSVSAVPANDAFKTPAIITGNQGVIQADNTLASAEPGEPDHAGVAAAHSLWWSFTAPAGGVLLLDATASSFPPSLDVYTGNVLAALTEVVSTAGSSESALRFTVAAGATYRIALDSPAGVTGPVALAFTFRPFPANDNFAQRQPLHGNLLRVQADNRGATREAGEPLHGGIPAPGCASLWWTWTAPADGQLTLSATQTNGASLLLGLYAGDTLTNLTPQALQWDYSPSWSANVQRGVSYQIAADSPADALQPGPFELDLSFVPEPSNDRFAGRTTIRGSWVTVNESFALATAEPNTPARNFGWLPTLWWSWTAPFAGTVTINSSQFIDVFTGSALTNLTPVTSSDAVTFPTAAGVTYAIACSGFDVVELNVVLSTLRLASPVEGGSYTQGVNLVLNATTAHNDPPLSHIQYWANGQTIATTPGLITGATWRNVPAGIYALTAVGTDSLGHLYSSPPVNITVQYARPRNDNFANRTVLHGTWIALTNSNLGATAEPGEPDYLSMWGDSLWWTWTAPASGRVTLSNPNSGAAFGVFTGNSLASLTVITHGYFPDASLEFTATAGTTYNIGVAGWSGDVAMQLVLSNLRLISPADGSVFVTGSNLTLVVQATPTEQTTRQVEFFHDGVSLGVVTKAPYTFTWTNLPGGASSLTAVATDTTGHARSSPPVSVQVRPPNDDFTNAVMLTGQFIHAVGSTIGATIQPGEPRPTGLAGMGSTVWYAWTAPAGGRYTARVTTAIPWENVLEVWTGPGLSDLACVGDPDTLGTVTFTASAGATYYLSVDNANSFALDLAPVPANDNFVDAQALTGTNASAVGMNSMATREPGEPYQTPGIPGGHSVWYSWTAPSRGLVTVGAASTNFTPYLNVFLGTNVAALTPVGTNTSTNTIFVATAGKTYAIAVDGAGGFFTLNLKLTPPAGNDDFAARFWLTGMNPSVQGSTRLATTQAGEPGFSPWVTDRSVWYAWQAPADGTVRVHCPTQPVLVCTGGSLSNLVVVAPPNPATFTDLVFSATAGTEYDIAVAGAAWLPEDFTLSLVMPKAQIASPTNGAAFPAPAAFTIVARTIDLDGAVVSVRFYDGTNLLATATHAPFQMAYTNVPSGSHELSLQATDQHGRVTTSEPVEVRSQPANDDFVRRIFLSGTVTNWTADNSGATTELGEFLPGGATGRTLWWSWTAPTDGTVTINANGFTASSTPLATLTKAGRSVVIIINRPPIPPYQWPPGPTTGPLVAVYTNLTLTNLSLCASNSGWAGWPQIIGIPPPVPPLGNWYILPSFTFPVTAGQPYQLSLDGVNGSFGAAALALAFTPLPVPPPPPANDNFAQATVLSGSSLTVTGTTVSATREPGEPLHSLDPAARTVWYSWTAPASGTVGLSVTGDTNWPLTAVYAGHSLWNLIPVAPTANAFAFYALAGTTYKLVVAGPNGLETGFSLTLSGPPAPPAIDGAHTVRLANGTYQVRVTGSIGQSFVVQASSDSRNWVTIRTDTLVDTTLNFVDTTAARFPRRFYRVLPLDAALNYQPLTLLAPAFLPDAGFALHLTGMAGQPFRLQTSTNLWDWVDLTGGVLGVQTYDFTDGSARSTSRQFYRAVTE